MRPNHVLRAWRAGKQTIGAWLSVGNSFTAEQMAGLGFDWVCLDMQHGLIDFEDVRAMLPAVSTTPTIPIVRVPWNDPWMCMKALDAGATRYTRVRGIPQLREAIRDDSLARRGTAHELEEIVVSSGAKQSLFDLALYA